MKRATVLVVEDNPITRKMFRVTLRVAGYRVLEAENGQRALDLIEQDAPDLILQDLKLPDMDGFELTKRLRATPVGASVPIVAVSGFLSMMEQAHSGVVGFTDFLFKPVEPSRLIERVQALLRLPTRTARVGAGQVVVAVDDDPFQLRFLKIHLEILGFRVITALDGAAAFAHAKRLSPQAVVSDVLMSPMDGFTLCQAIRRDPALADVPVVLISAAYIDEADHALARAAGANAYVMHSPDLRELDEALVDTLRSTGPPPKAQRSSLPVEAYLQRTIRQLGRQAHLNQLLTRRVAHLEGELTIVAGLANILAVNSPLQVILEETLGRCLNTAGLSAGAIYVFGQDGGLLLRTQVGYGDKDRERLADCFGAADLFVHGAKGNKPLVIPSSEVPDDRSEDILAAWRAQSIVIVPLVIGQDRAGVLVAVSLDKEMEADMVQFLQICGNHAAQAIRQARSIDERRKKEDALRRSEERYRTLAEAAHDDIVIINRDGCIDYINNSGAERYGVPAPQLIGKGTAELFPPETSAQLAAVIGKVFETGEPIYQEIAMTFPHQKVWLGMWLVPLKSTAGEAEAVLVVARDITLQREHEKHITRLNRVYAVLSGINTTIVRTRDRQKLFDEACRIAVELGKFRLAWIGLLDANGLDVTPVARAGVDEGYLDNVQLTARDDAPDRCEMVARALREKTAVVCNDVDTDPQMARWREEALRRSYRSVVVFPLQFDDKVLGVLVLYASEKDFFDTEEMKLLAELAGDVSFALDHIEADESRQVQSAALNAAADAIVITDRAGVIEWINPAFTQITGYTAEEALGKNPRDLVKSGQHAPAFYKDLWDTILAGRTWHGEMINRRKDGRLYTEDQSVTPILDASGAITHFVAVKQDMTERLQLEAQFRQAQKMESVGQLASGIAHDFNNLVTVINGMSDLVLAQVSQDDPVHADMQEIHRAGERAATLTRQLLAFSRQQILEPRVLKVNTVIAGMEDLLRRVLGEDIDLVVVPAPEVGHVKADPGQLEQVITNLAVNARDAMPQGGRLTIETESVTIDEAYTRQHGEDAPPGSYVRLTVSDSGAGMDEATRARIFEPFFTTKGPGKGTGLGLSTVYGIVTQSHGYIGVYSEVGRGTSFKIYLPQVIEAAGTDQPRPRAVSSTGTETILLAEDNDGLRKLATRLLARAGYTVLGAATGEEAVRLLERHDAPVHLLLSDVVMPGMSGRHLAEQLAQTRPGMKVLYMSGYTSDTIVRHGVLEAQVPFLNKPFTAAALLGKVREVLDP